MRTSNQGTTHAADFGVSGPFNKTNAARFIEAIAEHVRHPETEVINGTFTGGTSATHYVNPQSGLHASFAAGGSNVGEYLGGWKSSGDQLSYLLGFGVL